MKKALLSIAASAVVTTGLASAATERTLKESFSLEPGQTLSFDIPIAELRVTGTEDVEAEVEVVIGCSRHRRRCEENAEGVELRVRERNRRVVVDLDGLPRWGAGGLSLEIEARVPASTPVEIEMGVGEIEIEDLESDLTIDLGVGQVEIAASAAAVGTIELDTGVGQSSIERDGDEIESRRFFLGDEIRWSGGDGNATFEIDLGVGEIDVDLD